MKNFLRTAVGLLALTLLLAASCKTTESNTSGGGGGDSCNLPQKLCVGACVDPRFDPSNCGACGNACTDGKVCVAGSCDVSCPKGSDKCALDGAGGGAGVSVCADFLVDRNHCGACAGKCATAEVCAAGKCALECAGGATKCEAMGGPICADTLVDPQHCGSCDVACDAGFSCVSGVCKTVCVAGTTVCAVPVAPVGAGGAGGMMAGTGGAGGSGPSMMDICVDTKLDPLHCGACDNACPKGQVCQNSQCLTDCTGDTAKCTDLQNKDVCVHLDVDPLHCGACDNACPGGQVCTMGICALSCVGGTTKCDGACVDTKLAPANCGSCGAVCGFPNAGAYCSNSACTLGACNGSFLNCNKNAADGCEIDISTDVNHCGGCGKVCGTKCVGGVCQFAFKLAQIIDGQAVTCSSVNNANPLYTECDDLKNTAGLYFPNGITCGPQWSGTNSVYSDTIGFCQSLTGTAKMEAYYTCAVSTTRATWKNHLWGTVSDNGYTEHLRCYY